MARDEVGGTHIWHIPGTLLPYGEQVVDADVVYPLTPENDIGHWYSPAHDTLASNSAADTIRLQQGNAESNADGFRTLLYLSYSLHPSVQATLQWYRVRVGGEIRRVSQYRRWSLPNLESSQGAHDDLALFLPELEVEDVWGPDDDWQDPPIIFSSLSSCLYILPGPPASLMLIRYYDSPPKLSRHKLELPPDLEEVLLRVGHLVFDESLGVALLMLDDGTFWTLRFGPSLALLNSATT